MAKISGKKGISGEKPKSGVGYNLPMTTAAIVADYLLLKAQESGKSLTNKKLQKLLYYTQAWSVTLKNEPMFSDAIEAWIHGPAIRSVYSDYKEFGFSPIVKKLNKNKILAAIGPRAAFIDLVWNVYAKRDSAYLEQLTHSEDPWMHAREGLETNEGSSREITLDSMKVFYSQKLDKIKKSS